MAKRKNRGYLFMSIISCATFLFGAFFLVAFFARLSVYTMMIFAGAALVMGIAYLSYYSINADSLTGDWPMIEGLTDILLSIVLFMSAGTSEIKMLMYILSIWALTGALSRFASAVRSGNKHRRQTFFNAGACLLAAVFMCAMTLFTRVVYPLTAGVGLMVYALGSVIRPKKASLPQEKRI